MIYRYILIFLLTVQDSDLIPHMEGQAISRTTLAAVAFEASASYEQIRPTYPLETVRFLLRKLRIIEHNKIENYTFTRNLFYCSWIRIPHRQVHSSYGWNLRRHRDSNNREWSHRYNDTAVLPCIEILQCRAENIGKSGLIHFCVTLRNSSNYL